MKALIKVLIFIILLINHSISASEITVVNGMSIQTAIDNAVDGDIIKVAAGTFNESIVINQKSIVLKGGYNNDFTIQDINQYITIINSINLNTVAVLLTSCTYVTIDGFTIKNGRRGVEMNDIHTPIVSDNIIISNNIIEDNGTSTESYFYGGGIKVIGSNVFIRNNTIRNNEADRGGGIGVIGVDNFILDANIIEDNVGHGDHGGGITLNGAGLVSNNIIRRNRIGESLGYGVGGGALAYNYNDKIIRFNHNIWSDNYAQGRGGAMIIDDGCVAYLDNELFYNNTTSTNSRGTQIYVDDFNGPGTESVVEITNSTFFGVGSFLIDGSIFTIKNSIVWSPDPNSNTDSSTENDDFHVIDNGESTFNVSYSLFQDPDYINTGTGNINLNPLFVNPSSGDFHLQSTIGHWNNSSWIIDTQDSPAIDAGNPNDAYNLEPSSNGNRINMGCYGNTVEASKSGGTLAVENLGRLQASIYPNPVKKSFTISTVNNVLEKAIIYNGIGQVIKEFTTNKIDISNLTNGIYFVKVISKNGKITTNRILKY